MNAVKAAAKSLVGFGANTNSNSNDNDGSASDRPCETDTTNASVTGLELDRIGEQLFNARLRYTNLMKYGERGFATKEDDKAFHEECQKLRDQIHKESLKVQRALAKQQKRTLIERERLTQKSSQNTASDQHFLSDAGDMSINPYSANTSFFDIQNLQSFSEIERENNDAVQILGDAANREGMMNPLSNIKLPQNHAKDQRSHAPSNTGQDNIYSHKIMTPSGNTWRIPDIKSSEQVAPPKMDPLDPIVSSTEGLQNKSINSSMEVAFPSIQQEDRFREDLYPKEPPPKSLSDTNIPSGINRWKGLNGVMGLNSNVMDTPTNSGNTVSSGSTITRLKETQDSQDFPIVPFSGLGSSSNPLVSNNHESSEFDKNVDLNLKDLNLELGYTHEKMDIIIQRFQKLSRQYVTQSNLLEDQQNEIALLKDANLQYKTLLEARDATVEKQQTLINNARSSGYKIFTDEELLDGLTEIDKLKRDVQKLTSIHTRLTSPTHSTNLAYEGIEIPLVVIHSIDNAARGLNLAAEGASVDEIEGMLGIGNIFNDGSQNQNNNGYFYYNEEATKDNEQSVNDTINNINRLNLNDKHDKHNDDPAYNDQLQEHKRNDTPDNNSKQVKWKSPSNYRYYSVSEDEGDFDASQFLNDASVNPNAIPIFRSRLDDNLYRITAQDLQHFTSSQLAYFYQFQLKKSIRQINDLKFMRQFQEGELENSKRILRRVREFLELFGAIPPSHSNVSNNDSHNQLSWKLGRSGQRQTLRPFSSSSAAASVLGGRRNRYGENSGYLYHLRNTMRPRQRMKVLCTAVLACVRLKRWTARQKMTKQRMIRQIREMPSRGHESGDRRRRMSDPNGMRDKRF